MHLHRFFIGAAVVLALAGCGGSPEAVAPPSTATTAPDCKRQSATFIGQIEPLAREWDDAVTLANSTQRASLSAQIDKLQALRRRAEDLQAPECAAVVKQHLVDTMDITTRGFLAFLGQKDSDTVFALAAERQSLYTEAMRQLQAGAPVPTAEPVFTDGLGVAREALRPVYANFTAQETPLSGGASGTRVSITDESGGLQGAVELLGASNNLQSAAIQISMNGTGAEKLRNIEQSMRSLLKLAAPDWSEGDNWLTAAMKGGNSLTTTRGRIVRYGHNDGADESFSLSVSVP
jgi:hypothetical protein